MLDCASPGMPPEFLEQVIASALDDFDGPIAIGLRSGHVSRRERDAGVRRDCGACAQKKKRSCICWSRR